METSPAERSLEENLESMKRLLEQPFYRFSAPPKPAADDLPRPAPLPEAPAREPLPEPKLNGKAHAPAREAEPSPAAAVMPPPDAGGSVALEEPAEAPIREIRRAPELLEEPAKQRSAGLLMAILTGLLIVLLLALRFWFSGQPKFYKVPFSNPTALAWVHESLWAADWVSQSVYRLEPQGDQLAVVQKYALPKSHITGLAVAGNFIYTCDGWKKKIQKRRMDDVLSVEDEVASPGPSPSCLYWDGRSLWSCDSGQHRIYRHEPDAALTVTGSYPSPGSSPMGLAEKDGELWSGDAESRGLYLHRRDDAFGVAAEEELPLLKVGDPPLSAMAFEQGNWWAGRDGEDTLIRFPPAALRRK